MVKKTTLFGLAGAAIIMFSCQKDNSQDNGSAVSAKEQENWLTANLDANFANSQKQVTAYLFSTDELSKLVETPNVENVQFVLGYSDNTVQIKVIGVDKAGKELASVDSKILKDPSYDAKLAKLENGLTSKTDKGSALLNEHLMLSQEAFDGIVAWQEKLKTVSGLNEVTSYEGARFQHYSLEAAVVVEMLKGKDTPNIGVFLGLNGIGKVTTILVELDKNNAIKSKLSLTGKTMDNPEDVYDGTRPSPPY
ncbi:hypothetical protein [Flavobacterium sp. LC2016-01]|uniref:hypothetical protein n=1 Tax=Flavobacterium sp. LC2016-01 TaxID=2675876 RepID=UPI0012BB11DD|nr:hypothetical protein [Flavobacterium sp. LC2016-01]MTH17351.1 hypothetical protein [Flavobacterium sp. LC2016-01]